jgi:CO/xanthine dehydrogenase FAD-binding subunit
MEKGRLRSIGCLVAITQLVEAEAEDAVVMALVQALGQTGSGRVRRLLDRSSPTD